MKIPEGTSVRAVSKSSVKKNGPHSLCSHSSLWQWGGSVGARSVVPDLHYCKGKKKNKLSGTSTCLKLFSLPLSYETSKCMGRGGNVWDINGKI